MYDLETDLLGTYQQHNIKTILAATELLIANQGLSLSITDTIKALSKVKKLTGLRGRWERLSESPLVIGDVAHNPAGLKEVLDQWSLVEAQKKHIVVGFVKDKDVQEALSFFPKEAQYHFCNAAIPRALPAAELMKIAEGLGLEGITYDSVDEAIKGAKERMSAEDALLIVGSFFIVGEAIESLNHENKIVAQELPQSK
jgi:dihydrofolate synthase/folylpolyglutamate synthase